MQGVEEYYPVHYYSGIKGYLISKLLGHPTGLFGSGVTGIQRYKLINQRENAINDEQEQVSVFGELEERHADDHNGEQDVVRSRAEKQTILTKAVNFVRWDPLEDEISDAVEHGVIKESVEDFFG